MREDIGQEKEVDMLDYLSRVASELICQAGLGYSPGLLEGKRDAYGMALKNLM